MNLASVNYAVLSNINLDPLKSFLPAKETYFCDYGQYLEELINEDSLLNRRPPEIILLHLEGEELMKSALGRLYNKKDAQKIAEEQFNYIFGALTQYHQAHPNSLIIITTVVFSPLNFLNYLDVNTQYSFSALEDNINKQIIKFSQESPAGIYILDWRKQILLSGYQNMVDEKFWYLGRIKYTNTALKSLAREFENIVGAIRGKTKKVLVLDLDNTLWGGIVGEDGIDGIQLSEDGIGKAFRDFQSVIKALTDLGIVLAINSKNNSEDVDEVFTSHPMMLLKKNDFAARKINWHPKSENMKQLAEDLNLGLDSFVFIDDNPREREIIKEQAPQVAVPDFPDDPVYLKRWFLEKVVYPYFPKVSLTEEDRKKTGQYKAYGKRKELSNKGLNLDEFIRNLNIVQGIYINDRRFITRTAQLTQKTNQFNMTTRRYTEADIENFIEDDDHLIFNFDYTDTFGEEGIVGAAIVKQQETGSFLDTFLVSCRVIGRNVEYVFLYQILDYLKRQNLQRITAEFRPSKKNVVAEKFYKNIDFARIENRGNSIYLEDTLTIVQEKLKTRCQIDDITVTIIGGNNDGK